MRATFAIVAALGAAAFVCGCKEEKRPTEAAPSASAPAPIDSAVTSARLAARAEAIAKTMRSVADAWNSHDATKVAALYAQTAKVVAPGSPDLSGRDAIAADARDTFTAYPDFKVAITKIFPHGNSRVIFEWVATGKNDGPRRGQKPSGRQMGVNGVSVARFGDDGLITEDRRYVDAPTIKSQLDATAKAGTFRGPVTLPTGAWEEHATKNSPLEAKTLETGKAFYDAFEKKGADMSPFVTEHSTLDDYTSPATVKGVEATKDYVDAWWKAFPDLAQTTPLQFAAGDTLVTEGVLTATQKGPLGPIKATNKPVVLHFVDVAQIADGKVVHLDSYSNRAEILIAIGAMPAPGAAAPAGSGSAVPGAAPMAGAKLK